MNRNTTLIVLLTACMSGGAIADVMLVNPDYGPPTSDELPELDPQLISGSYDFDKCSIEITMSRSPDRHSLTKLEIKVCSRPIAIDGACAALFVEPDMRTLSARKLNFPDDNFGVDISIGVKRFSSGKRSIYDPPLVRMLVDRNGIAECKEYPQAH